MSTVVYQGLLQSCVESQLVESRTLRLKLASPKLKEEYHSDKITKNPISSCPPNMAGNGWNFIQSLSSLTSSPKLDKENENIYVHPLVKKSSSTLSEKSLEMCTENLGCETGTDITESSIFSFSSFDNEFQKFPSRVKPKPRDLSSKKFSARSFPPPLTTMRGSESIRCRPHREEGRLVINAIKTPLKETLFQVERSNGRLRLCILKNNAPDPNSDSGVFVSTENERKINANEKEWYEKEVSCEVQEEEEDSDALLTEDIIGNNTSVEVIMGMGNYLRASRCMEDGYGKNETLLKMKPFLVASS